MKNWMTTVGGLLTAAGQGLVQSHDETLKSIGTILTVIGPALLGLAAKDLNVTGGTKEQ